jgi:hypothetical protein
MSCSNCYNGCTQIVSDQCIKYTGVDIPVLGIKTGDSLSYVEQAITEFLVSTLDGTGIKLTIDQNIICQLVSSNLPTCGDLTALDLFNALIKSVCSLQAQIISVSENVSGLVTAIDEINAPYAIPSCLEGLDSTSTTHEVLQNMITSFCGFVASIGDTYVKIADLDTLIAQYLQGQQTSDKYYTKMVPYVAMEFYPIPGILNNFDNTGAGISGTIWEKIYLCNGLNGTPDKRGVVAVGVTDGTMLGNPMNPLVNPTSPGNPTYTYNAGIVGTNTVQLSRNEMPSHTHAATATLTDPGHSHTYQQDGVGTTTSGQDTSGLRSFFNVNTSSSTTGITVSVTNAPDGGNAPHSNYQPGIGCYYIMYIP